MDELQAQLAVLLASLQDAQTNEDSDLINDINFNQN